MEDVRRYFNGTVILFGEVVFVSLLARATFAAGDRYASDDNAFVERVIRTIKEEEVWPNHYDTFIEAHEAVDAYVRYYNSERLHSALDYRTPDEAEAQHITLNAA